MALTIEKMRFDMAEQQKAAEERRNASDVQQKGETRRFVISGLLATAALVGAGIALGNYVASKPQTITVHLDAPLLVQTPAAPQR